MGFTDIFSRLRGRITRRPQDSDGAGEDAVDGALPTGGAPGVKAGRRHRRRHLRRRATAVSEGGETEYYSADDMSLPPPSPRGSLAHIGSAAAASPGASPSSHPLQAFGSEDDIVASEADDGVVVTAGPGGSKKVLICPAGTGKGSLSASKRRLVLAARPRAGTSFKRKPPDQDDFEAKECYEQPDATTYNVRGVDYMKTKKKISSGPSVLRTLDIDVFATEFKLYHIARHLELPTPPKISDEAIARGFTPMLIVNLQCPLYNPSPFGVHDGDGGSLIYYLVFPEGWHPDDMENQAALSLLEKFWNGGTCDDGVPARDRLKLIPRISNVEEWYRVGPLSNTEYKLLVNYNDKPVLTRPQQRFYRGPDYLEVDIDVHSWNYVARRAFFGYIPKLADVVFENALVVQGNCPEELPEQVLGCARVFRVDFNSLRRTRRFPLKEDIDVQPSDMQKK